MTLGELANGERVNAVIGWMMIGIVMLGAAESFLMNALLWGVFSLLVVAVAAIPALTNHDWMVMVPWPVLLVAAIAVVARAAEFYSEAAGYLAIATLALIVVVELEAFTPVELSRWFAVSFAVLTTLAIQSLWIITQFYSDLWLGTAFLTTQTELQEDIVIVSVVGVIVGGIFYWYFSRFEPAGTAHRSADRTRTR